MPSYTSFLSLVFPAVFTSNAFTEEATPPLSQIHSFVLYLGLILAANEPKGAPDTFLFSNQLFFLSSLKHIFVSVTLEGHNTKGGPTESLHNTLFTSLLTLQLSACLCLSVAKGKQGKTWLCSKCRLFPHP